MSVKRLFSSLVLIGIAIVAIRIDWLCALLISILAGLGLYEFFSVVEKKGLKVYRYLGLIIGLLIPLSVTFRFELTKRWEFFFIIGLLVIIYILQLFRKDSTGAKNRLASEGVQRNRVRGTTLVVASANESRCDIPIRPVGMSRW